MRIRFSYVVFGLCCGMGLLLCGCSIAQKAPESYLTEEYYAAPVLAAVVEPAAVTDILPTSFNRTTSTPVKPAKGKPPKAVHISATAAAAPAAAETADAKSTDPDKTYTESVTDDKKATYNHVEVAAHDVVLENKYIRGNLTVTADAFSSLTLINCKIDGELIVNSRSLYNLFLTDCSIKALRLASGEYIDVELEGVSYINETVITSGTAVSLYEYNIQSGYSGYKAVTIAKSSKTVELDLFGVDCNTLTVNSESEITLSDDNPAYVEAFIANAPVYVRGASRIDKFYVRSKGIVLEGEPRQLIYDKSKYTVEYYS